MKLYNRNVFFDKETYYKNSSINKILIEETTIEVSSKKFPHTIRLHNNQDREVYIHSDIPFNNLSDCSTIIFIIKDVILFIWKIGENNISYKKLEFFTENLLEYWSLHLTLPLKFTFDNSLYFLHTGAIIVENSTILLAAPSFGGKSTLTNHFIQKKHPFLSDDKVGVSMADNEIYATSSYPYHRPYRSSEDLGKKVENFVENKQKIKLMFNLVKSEPDAIIKIEKKSGVEKFKILKESTDVNIFSIYKKERFEILSNIANNLDVYDITVPWDLDRLEEVYQAIVEFIKKV